MDANPHTFVRRLGPPGIPVRAAVAAATLSTVLIGLAAAPPTHAAGAILAPPGAGQVGQAAQADKPCAVDIIYILDLSGSMRGAYPGSGTKLEAAKSAILTLNDEIAALGTSSRAALVTFRAEGRGQGNPPLYPSYVNRDVGLTSDCSYCWSRLMHRSADGWTPPSLAPKRVPCTSPGELDRS